MASNSAAPKGQKNQKRDFSSQSSKTNARPPKRQKTFNARQILTQTSDPALKSGELDISSFLKAREFEIKALEDGMRRAKGALTKRAFQLVPWDMRRRTASHNVKRVPKRLQRRAKREMKDDNTPTVAGPKRPKTSRGWIRAETAKRLRLLARGKKARNGGRETEDAVVGRAARPKLTHGALQQPRPESKFRKRQIHKTWLPTHMFHAKRATMTPPGSPLWRFALPITPQQKCYRPTHRAGGRRGALVWDMSYMSTIGLQGTTEALSRVAAVLGAFPEAKKEAKWNDGKRTWTGWLSREADGQRKQIAQGSIIWCPDQGTKPQKPSQTRKPQKIRRKLFIRTHPAAFLEVWDEVVRFSKTCHPKVDVQDLRFEIGSIELTGPDSLEALIGTLHQYDQKVNDHGSMLHSLLGVTNAASLPANSLLSFPILDPRLSHPPQKLWIPDPEDQEAQFRLLETLAEWPADIMAPSTDLFDAEARHKATRLPSQKTINRRKGAAAPGEYPDTLLSDPPIPVLLYPSRTSASKTAQGTWTLLAPWNCMPAIWYSLVHFPLSTGGNPRFAGLQEWQQIHFERSLPCYPMDSPGTDGGWAWELQERVRRKKEWEARPKGKRVAWEKVDLGAGKRGEIGEGWACDFDKLMPAREATVEASDVTMADTSVVEETVLEPATKSDPEPPKASPFVQIQSGTFERLLQKPDIEVPPSSLATVRITLFSRGVPQPCARIHRLPSATLTTTSSDLSTDPKPLPSSIRAAWLSLVPSTPHTKLSPNNKHTKPVTLPKNATMRERVRALAQELLQNPPLPYPKEETRKHPLVPEEKDLVGYVTTGNFNLAAGAGNGIGTLGVQRFVEGVRRDGKWQGSREERLCVVRNAGEEVGRLGYWEFV